MSVHNKLTFVFRLFLASAIRDGFGVLRCPSAGLRQSIMGRSDFFVRFGDKEREAISNFDFLDDLSTTSLSTDSGDHPPSPSPTPPPPPPPVNHTGKYYLYTCSSSATSAATTAVSSSSAGRRPPTTCSLLPSDCRRQRRRRYSGLSLSDSCGDSD